MAWKRVCSTGSCALMSAFPGKVPLRWTQWRCTSIQMSSVCCTQADMPSHRPATSPKRRALPNYGGSSLALSAARSSSSFTEERVPAPQERHVPAVQLKVDEFELVGD